MSNPFDAFTSNPEAPKGNPFDQYMSSPAIDPQEQSVVSRVNNPKERSPAYFGLTEVPKAAADGLYVSLTQQPKIVAGLAVQQEGEVIQQTADRYKGESTWQRAKNLYMKRFADNALDDGEIPNVFEAVGFGYGTAKDLIYSGLGNTEAPKVMMESGKRLAEKTQMKLEKMGMVRPEGTAGGVAFDVSSGIGQAFISVGATVLTRDPKIASAYMALLQKTTTYQEVIKSQGDKPDQAEANRIAMKTAASTAALEYIGGKYFLSAAKGSTFLQKVLFRAAGQGVEEATQGAAEEAILQSEGVRNTPLKEAIGSVLYQGMIGFVSGAPVSTVATAMEQKVMKIGVPEAQAKKIVEEFVKNKETVVDAAAQLIDRETSGIAEDKIASQTLEDIMKNQVPVTAYDDNLVQDENPDSSIFVKIRDELPPKQMKRPLIDFLKNEGGVKVGSFLDAELRNIGINPQTAPGLFKKNGGRSYVDNIPLSEFNAKLGMVGQDDGNGYVEQNWMLERIRDETVGKSTDSQMSEQEAIAWVEDHAKSLGETLTGYDTNRILADMAINGSTPEQAIESYLERKAIQAEQVKEPAPDANDPRFSGELDILRTTAKPSKSKQELFQRLLDAEKEANRFTSEGASEAMTAVKNAVGKALTPISTRLWNINPKFEARLREFEFTRNKQVNADQALVTPFLEKYSKLSREDMVILDFAMKNGDAATIEEIANANDMTAEIEGLRTMLDGIYKRAEKVGLNIGYRKNYFPRHVTKPKKLLAYFEKSEAWNDINAAIKEKEMQLGHPLTTEEKAHLVNTLLRGYKTSEITLAKPGALKERNIDQVSPEINEFYSTTDQALLRYIGVVNDSIETRRFLGKDADTIEDSIGGFVLAELEKGTLTAAQAQELSEILKARFNKDTMNPLLQAYKNLSYIDTMGSPISAITQLGGLSFSLSNNGVYRVLKTLPKAIIGKTEVNLEDIGVDAIAAEFTDSGRTGNAVRKVFKLVGLEKLDRMDKLTFINSSLLRLRKEAINPTESFRKSLENIFDAETDSVISDLQNKRNSENVKLLLFNELLDIQPVALSEMPEMYLANPNGRIFYMLKSFTIKQYDIYRRQVFDEIRSGNRVKGLKNLTRLVAFMVMMNAGADFLKDLLLGRETEPEDVVITNIARIFGFSKYQVYSVKREGVGTAAFKTVAPPFKAIDSMSKDMSRAIDNGEVNVDELETVQSVPIAGKFYYWWFGAGADK